MSYRFLVGVALCAGAGLAWAHHAPGHGEPAGPGHAAATGRAAQDVSVSDCWIRAMPNRLPSAGYFVVRNQGARAVSLTGVASPAFGQSMLHQTVTRDGMARMQHIDAVPVPAGGAVEFMPGGHHAMLEQPVAGLAPGQSVAMTFAFGEAGEIRTSCAVRDAASLGAH